MNKISEINCGWMATFISGCIISWGGLALYNYSFDPYGVFKEAVEYAVSEPNLSYMKVNHVIKQPDKYSTFSLGSSRVSHVGLSRLGDAYSLNLSEAVPEENLRIIETLLEHKVKIRKILLGLDDISYLVSPDSHAEYHRLRPHPEVSGESWWRFYMKYAFRTPTDIDKSRVFAWRNTDIFRYDVKDTGRLFAIRNELAIRKDPLRHAQHEKFLTPYNYEGEYRKKGIEAIAEIVALCKNHDIKLYVFINPLHITTYLQTRLAQFSRFRRELAQLTDFMDFSGINSITTNSLNYYEASHYRPLVGKLMLEKMFPDLLKYTGPEDFGRLVSADTIEAHLASLEQELKAYPDVLERNRVYKHFVEGRATFSTTKKIVQLIENKNEMKTNLCSVDEVGILSSSSLFEKWSNEHFVRIKVRGWMGNPGGVTDREHFIVSLKNIHDGKRIYNYSVRGVARPDVSDFFKDIAMMYTGFDSSLDIDEMKPGDYKVDLMLVDSTNVKICAASADKLVKIRWM